MLQHRIRFQSVNSPAGLPDQDREQTLPVFDFDTVDGFTGLPTQMFYLSNANPGATIVQTDGDYVRTWTLLEVIQ